MFVKVFSQIYDGTLCTNGPWQALVTFQQLLVLADPDGSVDMTASAIARRTTIPLDIIETGIEALLQPDPESRTPAEEGRRIVPLSEGRAWGWSIVNYTHYRNLKREEDRRDYHREYWHKRKDRLNNSTETQHTQPNQPRQETVDNKQETKEKKTRATRSPSRPEDVSEQVWNDWLQLRQAKKAPVTATVLRNAGVEASKARMSLEAFLSEWCARGSMGLKADWLQSRGVAETPGDRAARERVEAAVPSLAAKKPMETFDVVAKRLD